VKPRLYSKDFKYVRAEDMDAQYLARRFRQIRAEQQKKAPVLPIKKEKRA
jgi:hypothetical protein